jgi:hypothetical protein
MAAGGVASGAAAAAAPPSAMMAPRPEDSAVSAHALAGCYEMNASTEVLPARFALDADSSAIPGLMSIRYVDADGRPTSPIADLGWTFDLSRVIVKTQTGETLLTLRKTGSAVAGAGRSGSRTGRVVSCTR